MEDGCQEELMGLYSVLLKFFGHQNWWPAESPFETIIGAILAQNVSWAGAYKAVKNLMNTGLLDPVNLLKADTEDIAALIRSSRYYNQKAKKIKLFIIWFSIRFDARLSLMEKEPMISLRNELLALKGFGPETVDSILLYAFNKPIFVVDAYTRRIGGRYGLFENDASYSEMQNFFMKQLPENVPLFNDFHAQIVSLGNNICRTKPKCDICPIRKDGTRINCRYGCNL